MKNSKFTPPSPMKTTPNTVVTNNKEVCPTSVSNADDVTVTSSRQKRGYILIKVLPLIKTHLREKLLQSEQ